MALYHVHEIKCPYSKRDIDPALDDDPKFYLKHTNSGVRLSEKHDSHNMQIEGQLSICEHPYCDIVC